MSNHPWKRCRYNGCDSCCTCGDECDCSDNFTTAEDLIEVLQRLDPKTRIVLADPDDDHQYHDIGFFTLCALKPYTTEFVYREYDENLGGYRAPDGAEQCWVISQRDN